MLPAHPLFETEGDASAHVIALFEAQRWRFAAEYELPSRARIDFVLLDAEGAPAAGVEIKRRLGDETKLSELANYFEQSASYAEALRVPVYLGPFVTDRSPMHLCSGGHSDLSASAAFLSLAGRMNVGLFVYRAFCSQHYFLLRGQTVCSIGGREDEWNPEANRFASSVGSQKRRA